jgi:hypothetical protein
MKKFTFIGCSITKGVGLPNEEHDENNYANLIGKHFNAKVKNLSKGGNSNYNIFITALNELLYTKPDVLFLQWSALNRLWLYPGPDTQLFLSHSIEHDYNYRGLFFSQKELKKLADSYHLLNHDYHNLMVIVNYSKILESVATTDTQIVFINGLIPWTSDIASSDTINDYSKNLSAYSKEILDFDTRNDVELNEFYTNLHLAVNSLQSDKWVNMFDSLYDITIDIGNDNLHPGIESHKHYASMIINYLKNDKTI